MTCQRLTDPERFEMTMTSAAPIPSAASVTDSAARAASSAAVRAGGGGLRIAVVGAGPVGLALALQAARRLVHAEITVYDALPADHDVSGDPRTLALSLGSVQELQRIGVWPQIQARAASIASVHVSQQQPALLGLLAAPFGWLARFSPAPGDAGPAAQPGTLGEPELVIHSAELGLPQLGAVASYGAIVAPLRAAWLAACDEAAAASPRPPRLHSRLGRKVVVIDPVGDAQCARIDLADGSSATHDLVVIAEGGVFAEQARKSLSHDYAQTAWVGTLELEGGVPGVAYERFTPQGPAALLPLPPLPGQAPGRLRAALVWCVARGDDPVAGLRPEQICSVLDAVFSRRPGRIVAVSPLKHFPLGLNAERSLVRGRSVRIGNAAQTLHPVGGQGLNLGLRDAAVLVDRLARLRPGEDLRSTLRGLDLQRAADRWSLIFGTDFLARSFTWSAPGLSTLRGAGIGLMQRAAPLRHALARAMMFGVR
jgi:2-octaprenyl-6-methoxyphenol hydroxylase